ncbi:MAG: HIT family protein [Pseudomonadota bacterium]
MNDTLRKFGYPASLIREYEHWCVLLRPKQVTLASLVLANRSEATRLSALPAEAFTEQHQVIADIERVLSAVVDYNKLNYLMLMMVDPHVHYHVIPRYEGTREFAGAHFPDTGWPALPTLGEPATTSAEQQAAIAEELRARW